MEESLFFPCGAAATGRDRALGEIHLIVGPMFSGKTTTLLRWITSVANLGKNVAMVKSSKDTRYATDAVVTHDGVRFPCWALPNLSSFKRRIGSDAYQKVDVIGIDEAQFFDDLYDFCCHAADVDRKIIIVAGLDGDFLRNSFGSILRLVPHADSIVKLTARCEVCGKKACFTLRKTQTRQTELIGGSDIYMPACRKHYLQLQPDTEKEDALADASCDDA